MIEILLGYQFDTPWTTKDPIYLYKGIFYQLVNNHVVCYIGSLGDYNLYFIDNFYTYLQQRGYFDLAQSLQAVTRNYKDLENYIIEYNLPDDRDLAITRLRVASIWVYNTDERS